MRAKDVAIVAALVVGAFHFGHWIPKTGYECIGVVSGVLFVAISLIGLIGND